MLDKLNLRSNLSVINLNTIEEYRGKNCIINGVLDRQYNKCIVIKQKSTHLITIKTQPKLSHISPITLETNPSRFKSLKEYLNFIEKFTPTENLEIKRIDHAVDLNVPLLSIYKSLKAKRKMKRTDYTFKDALTGFEIGKNKEVICVYDKGFERISKGKFKLIGARDKITRIEIRHSKDKVKHKLLSEISNYLYENPFSAIEFLNVKHGSELNSKQKNKAILLDQLCNEGGLQSAYKNLNKSSNFNRTWLAYFQKSDLNKIIENKYKQELQDFIGGKNE